jgi:basic amino acid/polyamine antiporter, APA family
MTQDIESPNAAEDSGSTCGPVEQPEGKAGAAEASATLLEQKMAGSGTLKRALSLFYVYIIATGAIFTFMGYWDGWFLTACGPFTFLAFGILTIAVLPIAMVYAEWAAMCPSCGVELVYGTLGLNKHWGFISTWLILAAWLAVPPAGTLGIVSWVNWQLDLNLSIGWIALISCLVLGVLTVISLYDIQLAGQIQTFMLIFAFAICIVVAIVWMSSDVWSWSNFKPFIQTGLGGGNMVYGTILGIALLITPYFGFEIVPNLVEEGTFPIKKMNKAILGCVLTCGAMYVVYFFALTGMSDWATLTGDGGAKAFASLDAMELIVPNSGGWAFWFWVIGFGLVVFPIGTCILGFWLSSVRMLYAAGRQNFLPKAFAKCNKHHQPILPNILIFVLSVAAILTMNYNNFLQTFFCLMSFCVAACYAIISLAGIITAVKHPEWERPYKIPGGMFMRVLSLIIAVVIAVFTALGQPGWVQLVEYLGVGFALWMWMILVKWRKEKVWMETPEGIKEY